MPRPKSTIILVSPAGGGRYTARDPDSGRVLATSREPFFAAARQLLAEGADPTTPLVMRWGGSSVDALRSTVGTAAGLTVVENDRGRPTFARFKPFDPARRPPRRSASSDQRRAA